LKEQTHNIIYFRHFSAKNIRFEKDIWQKDQQGSIFEQKNAFEFLIKIKTIFIAAKYLNLLNEGTDYIFEQNFSFILIVIYLVYLS